MRSSIRIRMWDARVRSHSVTVIAILRKQVCGTLKNTLGYVERGRALGEGEFETLFAADATLQHEAVRAVLENREMVNTKDITF